ncbi:MAG TPA: rod shape-determining protein MreD [Woeseiaceae bacterium]|nr:rod shape-determining protein MreD [Woeseiaceae bacterium]
MNRASASRRLPVLVCIIMALMLAIVPMPDWASPYRPDWVALTLIYWSICMPRTYSVGTAWIAGIVLDVAQGTLLGQHALALVFITYLTAKFHLQLRVFPMSQMTATVFALLVIYQFILFWINGIAGTYAEPSAYWGPLVSGTLLWPVIQHIFSGIRYRIAHSS